jgi:hypothetical protein
MAQHDFVISNQGFPATRSDINNFLQAVATTHSGTSTPSGAVAGTIWLDTTSATAPILKYYDGTDNITLATIDHVANTVNFSDSAFDLITDTTPQLGGNLDVNGNSIVSTSNANITLAPNGTGDVVLSADTVKIGDSNANATITTDGTGDLILNTNSGSSSGSITIADGADANITIEPNGTGDILLNADTVRVGDSGANATITSNGAGDLILNTNSGTTSGSITIADGANGAITIAGNGTGQIIVNAGAVGTPTIAPTGDTNTGIFFPSADTIAFTEGGTEAMRIDSDGDVGINTTSPETKLHVKGTSDTVSPIKVQGNTSNGTNLFSDRVTSTESFVNLGAQWSGASMVLGSFVKPSTTSDSDATGYISSWGASSVRRSAIVLNGGEGSIKFLNTNTSATVAVDTAVAMSERMRIDSGGNLFVGKTASSASTVGIEIQGGGFGVFTRSADQVVLINRLVNDGTLIAFRQDTSEEGSISVSGATVSYNGFTGSHWSRFIDDSKPDVLRGTVMESLDQMVDWYAVEFEVSTTKNDEIKTHTEHKPYSLKANEQEGDVITYAWNTEKKDEDDNDIIEQVQATIVKEKDVKHVMSKISDTSEAKNVYGVFSAWDNDDLINNDFYVASVGSYVVRIKAGQVVSKGDLLQSNGDGTAKVQADDLVRASSFAKVLSNTVIDTYEDGSFIVPCSLMC